MNAGDLVWHGCVLFEHGAQPTLAELRPPDFFAPAQRWPEDAWLQEARCAHGGRPERRAKLVAPLAGQESLL